MIKAFGLFRRPQRRIVNPAKIVLASDLTNPSRTYGPRVYTDKNVGRNYGMVPHISGKITEITISRMTGKARQRFVKVQEWRPKKSRYMPHTGKKQIEKARKRINHD